MNYDIWHTKGNMYTKHDIDRMIANSEGDPNQEYLCRFRFGKDSTLGEVTDSDRVEQYAWNFDPEDDGYEEPDDYDDMDEDETTEWRPNG